MLHDNNLIEMSLRLNRSEPLFRTVRELRGIGKRHRTRNNIGLQRNLPLKFMIVRQKPTQTFTFKNKLVSIEFRFSFTNIVSLKKSLQRKLQALKLLLYNKD